MPSYDSALQMFVEEPHELDDNHLGFIKWLIDNGRMEPEETMMPAMREEVAA